MIRASIFQSLLLTVDAEFRRSTLLYRYYVEQTLVEVEIQESY